MDKLLKQRLDILKEAGEISQDIKEATLEFISKFENKYSLEMTEENSSMLVTHLAMALSRIKKGEEIEEMNEMALEEVKQSEIYCELPEFYEAIETKLNIEIPESEKGFLALHACTLVKK
ncbi:PRD domain-containing protein [Clostridium sp. D2Q-11]|uniref:PRD domain-containing protein n=1 Tax=Anaeromonas frigoriresistens TaxID=2683708 RepID=A0A942UUB6_9FIRM|nr:PRD domain-containing protein [Anaeromonas frigoriresistens]MBS4538738.1 PRD domain-containing protein [Anaeromonas frigoriresistens]